MTGTPLVGAECQAMGQHLIVWCGIGLCCVTNHSRDEQHPPRLSTIHSPVKPPRSVTNNSPRKPHGPDSFREA